MRKSHTAPGNLAAAASYGPTPKQQSLTYGDVKHPPAVGFLNHMSLLCPSSLPSPMAGVQQPTVPQPIKVLSIQGITHCLTLCLFIRIELQV